MVGCETLGAAGGGGVEENRKGGAGAERLGPHPVTHTQKGSVGSLVTQQSRDCLQHDPRIKREGAY